MIRYRHVMENKQNDGFTTILQETSSAFADRGVQVMGLGFKDMACDKALMEEYLERLCTDLPADDCETTLQLLENSYVQLLEASTITGIQPYASMTFPVIRKMWTKIGMRQVIPTEPTKLPTFAISWFQPLLVIDGVKYDLPDAFKTNESIMVEKKKIDAGTLVLPVKGVDVMSVNGQTKLLNDTLSNKFFVSKVNITCLDADGANAEVVAATCKIERGLRNELSGDVSAAHTDGTVTTDTLFGRIDLQTGLLDLTSLEGNVVSAEVTGWYSSESHERTQEVTFETRTKDINIGDGDSLDASLPKQFLTDTKALYNIDAAAKLVDILSNTFATKIDFDLQNYLEESYQSSCVQYTRSFNCRPSFGYAHSPREWREELKQVIDHLALTMMNDFNHYDGTYIIYGNPIDVKLIPNINWSYTSGSGERGGVKVGYSLGAVGGDANLNYYLVSIPNVSAGSLRMVFIPSLPDLMTYKYYPYAFSIESSETGYRNPNRPNVPSLTMLKRDTIEELIPICGRIIIENNSGTLPGNLPQVTP
jgi:hypothetical protein